MDGVRRIESPCLLPHAASLVTRRGSISDFARAQPACTRRGPVSGFVVASAAAGCARHSSTIVDSVFGFVGALLAAPGTSTWQPRCEYGQWDGVRRIESPCLLPHAASLVTRRGSISDFARARPACTRRGPVSGFVGASAAAGCARFTTGHKLSVGEIPKRRDKSKKGPGYATQPPA
jgi:hypothetical protein